MSRTTPALVAAVVAIVILSACAIRPMPQDALPVDAHADRVSAIGGGISDSADSDVAAAAADSPQVLGPVVGAAETLGSRPSTEWVVTPPVDGSANAAHSASTSATSFTPYRVIDSDFPDPDVIEVDGVSYAYATNSHGKHVPMATETPSGSWKILKSDALPQLPSWSSGKPGYNWAPDVTEIAPGQFRMYFTTSRASDDLQCVGVATSSAPTGPFTPVGSSPLVCPAELGGAIDATTFRDDDGSLHLVWKTNGNSYGIPVRIQTASLDAGGTTIIGEASTLVMVDLIWESTSIEGPTLIKRDGVYHLFYSASNYSLEGYAIGHATSTTLAGPWLKDCEPVLSSWSGLDLFGPGGQDVSTDATGHSTLYFAAWDSAHKYRAMYRTPLEWQGSQPIVPGAVDAVDAPRATSGCDASSNGLTTAALG